MFYIPWMQLLCCSMYVDLVNEITASLPACLLATDPVKYHDISFVDTCIDGKCCQDDFFIIRINDVIFFIFIHS